MRVRKKVNFKKKSEKKEIKKKKTQQTALDMERMHNKCI